MKKLSGLFLCCYAACAPSSASAQTLAQTPSVANGWRVLLEQRLGNCVACHAIPDAQGKKSGIQSTFAPALDGVASRYNPETLRQWVVDARKIKPETLMPPFGLILSPEQVTDVLAAMQTLR